MSDPYLVSDADGAKQVPVQPREALVAPTVDEKAQEVVQEVILSEEVTEAVAPPPANVVYGHCRNCRIPMTEDKVTKQGIDYLRDMNGTLTKIESRFSVFCKQCMSFVTIIDRDAKKLLDEMIAKIPKK